MTDILWRKTTYSDTGTVRYIYKPVSPAGIARFEGFAKTKHGWYGFGDWEPDSPFLHFAEDGLTLTEDTSNDPS